jgi:geranylgeranyl pyrophosphate synthase
MAILPSNPTQITHPSDNMTKREMLQISIYNPEYIKKIKKDKERLPKKLGLDSITWEQYLKKRMYLENDSNYEKIQHIFDCIDSIESDKNMIELLKEIKEKLYALQEYIVETHPKEGWEKPII